MKEKFFDKVIHFRIPIMILFLILALICGFSRQFIQVNYDMNDYLPEDSPSTVAIDVMEKEFDGAIPNARVAIKNVGYVKALEYKEKIEKVKGVESVTWIDDKNVMNAPLRMLDQDMVEEFYKDKVALFTVTIQEEHINDAVDKIRSIIGKKNSMTGSAVSTAIATKSTVSEIRKITVLAIILVLFILIMTTTSWIEPLVILIGIGVAVVINAGSNLMFGEVSFVTNAAGNILQLAVSLDYSVFLIHRFEEYRSKGFEAQKALKQALCSSMSSILSSGLTTVIGFLALLFMHFGIGPDLGRALAKGILISLLTVFIFMPGVIMLSYKWIEKTEHKSFMPSFHQFGELVSKITTCLAIVFCILIIPSYYFSNHNSYYYGSSHIFDVGTQYGNDTKFIEDKFGIKDTYVLMVPNNSDTTERKLCEKLKKNKNIISVTSLADICGPSVPTYMVPESISSQLRSDKYSRIVLSVSEEYEGDATFDLVKKIRKIANSYYGNTYYLAGQGVSTYDLMYTITADMTKVNLVAIGAVFVVLLITLRSIKLPVVLVATIETAIWINLTIPYLCHQPLFYIAYLIISSVQLGATVDYAILFTDRYRENRKQLSKKESVVETISQTTISMLTSGLTLTVVGFLLGIISTHGLLSQLGYLLGKGTICSLIAVLFVLPGLLSLFEGKKKEE